MVGVVAPAPPFVEGLSLDVNAPLALVLSARHLLLVSLDVKLFTLIKRGTSNLRSVRCNRVCILARVI